MADRKSRQGSGGISRIQACSRRGACTAPEDVQGPPVEGHVVRSQNEHVILRTQSEQQPPQERVVRNIEWPALLSLDPPVQLDGLHRFGSRELVESQVESPSATTTGSGIPARTRNTCAQRLVAMDDLFQRPSQAFRVQGPEQCPGERNVVGNRTRVEPVDEPDALLGEGKRCFSARNFVEPRDRAVRTPARGGWILANPVGQAVDRGVLNRRRAGRLCPSRALNRAVIAIADNESPPRTQKSSLMPTFSTPSTEAQTSAISAPSSLSPGVSWPSRGLTLRHWQEPARRLFYLAGLGRRQVVEQDISIGHHIVGKPARGEFPQLIAVEVRLARHEIRNQSRLAIRTIPASDGDLSDRVMSGEDVLDFSDLDPVAADLHLLVGAATEEFQAAIRYIEDRPFDRLSLPGRSGRSGTPVASTQDVASNRASNSGCGQQSGQARRSRRGSPSRRR